MKHYGWFSPKQAAMIGYWIYATPDGSQVMVSTVTSEEHTPEGKRCPTEIGWRDYKPLGEVTTMVSRHPTPYAVERDKQENEMNRLWWNRDGRWR